MAEHRYATILSEIAKQEPDPARRSALLMGAARIRTAFAPPPDTPSREPDYYHLTPGWVLRPGEPGYGGIATAALMCCVVTGKVLDGMGGPGFAIHPSVIKKGTGNG